MKPALRNDILRKIGIGLLFLLLMDADRLGSQEVRVPEETQFELFSKVLIFDRNLRSRTNGEIVFGIIYQSLNRASLRAAEVFEGLIHRLPGNRLCGLPVKIVMIDLEKNQALDQAILVNKPNILYVAPLRAFDPKAISAVSQAQKILTLTGVPDYLYSDLSVSIDSVGGKPQVLINLSAAISEGCDFSSKLLNLATIINPRDNSQR